MLHGLVLQYILHSFFFQSLLQCIKQGLKLTFLFRSQLATNGKIWWPDQKFWSPTYSIHDFACYIACNKSDNWRTKALRNSMSKTYKAITILRWYVSGSKVMVECSSYYKTSSASRIHRQAAPPNFNMILRKNQNLWKLPRWLWRLCGNNALLYGNCNIKLKWLGLPMCRT